MIFHRIYVVFLFFCGMRSYGWGFFAHKKINEMAVFSLPPEMMIFYKEYLDIIREGAVAPDRRRYVVEGEGPRHYIDMEYYVGRVPCSWHEVGDVCDEDGRCHGVVPWHILRMMGWLTRAFESGDGDGVVRLCTEIGHYVGDVCVPLHTTRNYDGQETGQRGIHGLWESRLPELFCGEYDLFVGGAYYIEDVYGAVWGLVEGSYVLVEGVLGLERELDARFPFYEKYCFERRGGSVCKVYSRAYARAYHEALDGMVEARMRRSILMVASVWYTCWVNAGQPSLSFLLKGDVDVVEGVGQGVEEESEGVVFGMGGCRG